MLEIRVPSPGIKCHQYMRRKHSVNDVMFAICSDLVQHSYLAHSQRFCLVCILFGRNLQFSKTNDAPGVLEAQRPNALSPPKTCPANLKA